MVTGSWPCRTARHGEAVSADLFGHDLPETPLSTKRTRYSAVSPVVRMRGKFGNGPDGATCGGCAHLVRVGRNRAYFKCDVYGISSSEATDFRKKWLACGKFSEAS